MLLGRFCSALTVKLALPRLTQPMPKPSSASFAEIFGPYLRTISAAVISPAVPKTSVM